MVAGTPPYSVLGTPHEIGTLPAGVAREAGRYSGAYRPSECWAVDPA